MIGLTLVFVAPQHSVAQTVDEQIRVIGAGIGVIHKAVENERNERKERERREEEARRKYEREQKQAMEASKRAAEAAAREKLEREERERINRENEARERENRARAEWFEAHRANADRVLYRENSLRDAVIAGNVAYDDYNRLDHTVNKLTGSVCFFTDRKEQVIVSLNEMDYNNDQLLRISYRYNSNYGSVPGVYMYFPEVNVWIKYTNNQNMECVYSGFVTFYITPGTDYLEKLSTAFPIQKSVNLGNIDGISIQFAGGQILTN